MKFMKLLVAAFVLWGGSAFAQEAYTVNATTANQVQQITRFVNIENKKVCTRLGLFASCTQAQACTAANAPGGASCTAAQARGANVRIYPNTLAGREEWADFAIFRPAMIDRKNGITNNDRDNGCSTWTNGSAAQKDAMCATFGGDTPTTVAAGCDLGFLCGN